MDSAVWGDDHQTRFETNLSDSGNREIKGGGEVAYFLLSAGRRGEKKFVILASRKGMAVQIDRQLRDAPPLFG